MSVLYVVVLKNLDLVLSFYARIRHATLLSTSILHAWKNDVALRHHPAKISVAVSEIIQIARSSA